MDNLTKAFIKGCQDQDARMMANIMEMAKRNGLEVVEDKGWTLCKDGGKQRLMWTADIRELYVAITAIDWYVRG